ncbi:hypothetical protein NZD88_05040 [Chryseobacterium antibioticum]|uniref:Uncharacterized protein n=1 Tax=Chryseobacterium pyrolae TaxID=2987481 RepID=A0ABT2IE53_9FLAO|nr:hypothetical protein [Chryseobacterium pyrolae]MCT2406917.1 hypothetical protein [Chryseobacterium pyrolae]
MNRKHKIEYNKLKAEADEMDFDLLTRTLINDLDKRQFTRKYINFIYAYSRFVCDELNGFECISEYNLKDPFYNRNNWTADDLIYLGKKFKDKIIIPSKKGSGFGYNAGFYADDESKNEMFRKFKTGIIKNTGEEFYYYSKKMQSR